MGRKDLNEVVSFKPGALVAPSKNIHLISCWRITLSQFPHVDPVECVHAIKIELWENHIHGPGQGAYQ